MRGAFFAPLHSSLGPFAGFVAYPVPMRVFLGFDGGGTKTECVALDERARVVGRSKAGASNPTRISFESAAKAVEDAADLALKQTGSRRDEVVSLCAGLAGTGKPENRERMNSLLSSAFPGAAVQILMDLELPLAAIKNGPAIVLIAGTGSAAIGRDSSGRVLRAGGFGRDVSDEGSAYDVGRSAIEDAMKQQSLIGKDSPLGSQILRELDCRNWTEVLERIAENRDAVYPRIFPVIAAAADSGDESARLLLSDAAQKLAALVRTLSEQLGLAAKDFALARAGGMIGRSAHFDRELAEHLKSALPHTHEVKISEPAAETAAGLALRNAAGKRETAS